MEQLSKEEMLAVKGGKWVYNEADKKWYWITGLDLEDPI